MARVTAPLLSFTGSGQIAKTQVYSSWKGRPYVRRYVTPANPNTTAQQETRSTFRFLSQLWKFMPSAAIAGWQLYAANSQITDRNAWMKRNLSPLRSQANLANLVLSPSASSGLVAAAVSFTPGNDQVTVALTAPVLPAGWAIVAAHAAALRQQDPQTGILYTVTYGTDVSSPYSIVLGGLADAQTYVVGGWFEYTKADGSPAFGEATMGTALTT